MSDAELERRIKERLNSAGLLVSMDAARSQFLEVPGPFCELVLSDGSKLKEAREVIDGLKAEFAAENLRFEAIVRATWQAKSVKYEQPCPAKSGGIKGALCYRATLTCGYGRLDVLIEVGSSAIQTIRETLGSKLPAVGAEQSEAFLNIVRAYVQQKLDQGGTLCWNADLEPTLQIDAVALRNVWAHSAA